jgi:hypothetical protein
VSSAKIYSDIVTSPLCEEDLEVRWLATVLLLQCNRNGQVRTTSAGLARLANLNEKQAKKAFSRLVVKETEVEGLPPDALRVYYVAENWWQLVNYERYRDMRDVEAKREATRLRVAAYREREKVKRERRLAEARAM